MHRSTRTPFDLLAALLFAAVLLLAAPVAAQPPETNDDAASLAPDEPQGGLRARVVRKVRRARIELLTQELGLEPAQAEPLDALLVESDKARLAARRATKAARQTLSDALDAGADDTELQKLTAALEAAERSQRETLDALFTQADTLLDARQSARLRLVLPEFERKVRKLVAQAREKQQQKKQGKKGGPARGRGQRGRGR